MNEFQGYIDWSRPRPAISPALRSTIHVATVGAGALGRNVAQQLAHVGVRKLTLFDPGRLRATHVLSCNLETIDIGQTKVASVSAAIRRLNPDVEITAVPFCFPQIASQQSATTAQVVFICGKNIDRRQVWTNLSSTTILLIDGWIDGDDIRILTVRRASGDAAQFDELYPVEAANEQSGPSIHANYIAAVAAGLMLAQFQRWLRGRPLNTYQHFLL